MRNLKYAILGLLNREPLTGYDILKEFNSRLGNFWHATHSQIYPELRRLAEEGLVSFSLVANGDVEKKLYTITPKGKKEFADWLAQKDALEPTPKDIFRLKSYFLEGWTDEQLQEQFRHQLAQRREKLESLQSMMAQNYGDKPPENLAPTQLGDYWVLKGAILRETTNITWLEEVLHWKSGK